jgi:radical SAM superfamily enzyme YgiQ (UPF0313 family)
MVGHAHRPMSSPTDVRGQDGIIVVSCYELGHQPLAAASVLGFLRRAGYRPGAVDLAVEPLGELVERAAAGDARLVVISVPMHTALHVGIRASEQLRRAAPSAHVCFYGLYATLNAAHLLNGIADSVVGGELERTLVELADALAEGESPLRVPGLGLPGRPAAPVIERLDHPAPARDGLPPLERYAKLAVDGESRTAAAVETTRGCLHHCRHCPIPPVYGGRFFGVPREVVLQDIRHTVGRGARHLTFADPDFLNGPGHARAIVRAMHLEFPELTFDLTTKVEHVLRHRELLGELADRGCLFVISAVESLSDEVLTHLKKGHTREDVFEALSVLRSAGTVMRPTFVPFTPWAWIEDYLDLLVWIEREELIHHVDPVQFSIRLLVPPGSSLESLEAMRPHLGPLMPSELSYRWDHPDPRMDRLQEKVTAIVRQAALTEESAVSTFARIRDAAFSAAGRPAPTRPTLPSRVVAPPPRMTEPWFC